MTVLKRVDVSRIQAGDNVVINHDRFVVGFIEPDGFVYEAQLHDSNGSKVRMCLFEGETVSLEI